MNVTLRLCCMAKHRLQGPPWFCLNPEDLIDNVDELGFEELPPLLPCFSVPSLQDKPQNPIVERLNTREKAKGSNTSGKLLPSELDGITADLTRLETKNEQPDLSVWGKLDLDSHKVHSPILQPRTCLSPSRGNSFPGMHCGQLIKYAIPLHSFQREIALFMLQRGICERTMTK